MQNKKSAEPKHTKQRVIKTYLKAVKTFKRTPTEAELRALGLTRNTIRWHFANPAALKNYCRSHYPLVFANIIDDSIFNRKNIQALQRLVKNTSTIVVSTVVTGCKVHKGFYRAIQNYTKQYEAVDLYIPVTDPASNAGWTIAKELGEKHIIAGDLSLNSNIFISKIKMSAKQLDPTTSLKRMGHMRSFIFGSPKQRLKVKANSNFKHPHAAMGTGAVTRPNYATDTYMSERTAELAEYDHKIGAVVVELEGQRFYFRQIQAEKSGAFADLGRLYHPDGKITDYAPEYFVMGDLHPGDSDPIALACWRDVIKETKSKNVVLHDAFNGHSISHWVEGKIIEKSIMAKAGLTNLETEGKLAAQSFKDILGWLPATGKLFIVPSNHNDFLYRYINDKRFIRDHENLDFVAKHLLTPTLNGEDPAKVLLELFLTPAERSRIVWWKEDEDFRHAGVQLAAHGDRGPNGSRGTLKNQGECFGACIIGHSHTPGIDLDAYQVGTTTFRKLSYSKGPSSWMQTSCLLYKNGSRQLINCIEGHWRKKR